MPITPEEAARSLADRLRGAPWFTTVGVGEQDGSPILYLYVRTANIPPMKFLDSGWNGYRVAIKRLAPRLGPLRAHA
jgi:hypothetical protein